LGRPLWREDGSVVCNCYWPSPVQLFSGPSPIKLVAIFYCLRSETSLFIASYDSQGHGGGIRPHLHTPEFTNQPPFILAREPNRDHRIQGFHYCSSWIRSLGYRVLIPKQRLGFFKCLQLSVSVSMETVFRIQSVFRNHSLRGNMFAHSFPRNGPHATVY
jgi:hypothetical protein